MSRVERCSLWQTSTTVTGEGLFRTINLENVSHYRVHARRSILATATSWRHRTCLADRSILLNHRSIRPSCRSQQRCPTPALVDAATCCHPCEKYQGNRLEYVVKCLPSISRQPQMQLLFTHETIEPWLTDCHNAAKSAQLLPLDWDKSRRCQHAKTDPVPQLPAFQSSRSIYPVKAMLFLISAMAKAGFKPLGQVLEQFRMVWHRYKLMLLLSASLRCAVFSSRESLIHRYDWRRTAGPRYSSEFHQ